MNIFIAIMLILQIGKMFDDNFDQIFNLYSPSVYEVADVFETYVYRNGIQQSKFSYSAAVGLVKSVLALAMILLTNRASRNAFSRVYRLTCHDYSPLVRVYRARGRRR